VAVFQIRIHIFFGLPNLDSDPIVRGMNPNPDPALDPDNHAKIIRKILNPTTVFSDSF
jgi:hypothetical protein